MAVLSAKELKDRESPERKIDIGGGDEVVVRRPDLPTLVYEGVMPMPLLSAVVKSISGWAGNGETEVTSDMMSKDDSLRKFVDAWVCCTVVEPRIVRPPDAKDCEEPTPFVKPEDAVLVSDLTLATRAKIFRETFSFGKDYAAAAEAAKRFPDGGSGEGAGPDVQAVQPAAV